MSRTSNLYTLVVYFNDGKKGRFPSNDFRNKRQKEKGIKDPQIGILRLEKNILKKHTGKYEGAVMIRREDDVVLHKYDGLGNKVED